MFKEGDLVKVIHDYHIKGIVWTVTAGTEGVLGKVIITKNRKRAWELWVGPRKIPVAEHNISLKYSKEAMDELTLEAERLNMY